MKTAAPENKSLKTLKGQLFGAVSMMLVAAIALGTSTYAWFINNRTVEVEQMNLTVSSSTSLLVALQKTGGTYTGYKSLLTNADITGIGAATDPADWTSFFANKMVPASITSASLASDTPTFFATNNHVANGLLDQFEALTKGSADTNVGQGPVKKLGLQFKASSDVTVYFGKEALNDIADLIVTNTDATEVGGVDAAAQAAAIRSALRVAVVPQKTATFDANVAAIVFQFDDGAANGHANNTKYAGATPSTDISEPDGEYAAIASVDGTTKLVLTDGLLTVLVPGQDDDAKDANNALASVTTSGGSATVTAPASNGIELFKLKTDEERAVDVYIWLEGTDKDCLNQLSAYQFGLILPFAAADTTP
jgi:hypothetical protein